MKKYIYAVGLHSEGGLNILNRFLEKKNYEIILYLDSILKFEKKKNYNFVSSNLIKRLFHFLELKKKLKRDDHIYFLNGLPPILKLNCKISVGFQNANLFREFYKINFWNWLISMDSFRYLNFILNSKYVDNWYIFSPLAHQILKKYTKSYINIKLINIYDKYKLSNKKNSEQPKDYKYHFIYPAALMKHKNHKLLIDILISLSKENIFPKVLLTLNSESMKKIKYDELKSKYKLKLFNIYETDQKKFLKIYSDCKYLIYLSSNETIGLPLLEAYSYGLKTIAPDLSYTSQFIKPDYLYDINSKKELKNIIVKCMHEEENKMPFIKEFKNLNNSISFDDFINKVL